MVLRYCINFRLVLGLFVLRMLKIIPVLLLDWHINVFFFNIESSYNYKPLKTC